jgi:hypothetical protein
MSVDLTPVLSSGAWALAARSIGAGSKLIAGRAVAVLWPGIAAGIWWPPV